MGSFRVTDAPLCAMRKFLLLGALALLGGCVDGLGIQSSCTAEMAQVRLENGGRPPNASDHEEDRGDHVEYWEYFDSDRRYIFRWGVSYSGCQVERTALNLVPLTGGSLPVR